MKKIVKSISIFVSILTLAFYCYYRGFFGGFYFDDLSNLSHLNVYAKFSGVDSLINYVLSFDSGLLKRPVSTLSFLLHASSWPADAFYFKLVNFIFHALNSIILFLVIKYILKFVHYEHSKIFITSLLATTIWLLNPYFVSTVLYSVQRMAILPVTFVLLGFALYSYGRTKIEKQPIKGVIFLLISVYVCTTLSTLSKENGILLPILLYLYEKIIVSKSGLLKLKNKQMFILFYLPVFVIVIALTYKFPDFLKGYSIREFSFSERLLSQARVLMLYLYHLFIPEYFTEGVFTDGFVKSKSLFEPITTLLSIITITMLLFYSIRFKNKTPLISFVILYYFTANIIESSFIPLELYFEHRAYLPSVFVFVPVSIFLIKISTRSMVYKTIPFILVIFLSFNTFLKSKIWGNHLVLNIETAEKFPESIRASTMAMLVMLEHGYHIKGIELIKNAMLYHEDIQLEANLLNLQCYTKEITDEQISHFSLKVKNLKFKISDVFSFNNLINKIAFSECSKISSIEALEFITNIQNYNTGVNMELIEIYMYYNKALILASLESYDKMEVEVENFTRLDVKVPYPQMIFKIIDLLLMKGEYSHIQNLLNVSQTIMDSKYKRDLELFNKRVVRYQEIVKKGLSK